MPRLQVRPERVDAMLSTLREITPLATAFADNGETNIIVSDTGVVLEVCQEELPIGSDRVHERRSRLNFTWPDLDKFIRALDCARKGRRAGRWSETALAEMAQECVR